MVSTNSLASFAVGRPVHGAFTYSVPEALAARLVPGQRVLVPFGRTTALAFYLGPASSPPRVGKLRQVERELEAEPALPADVMALLRFASEHYRYPLGETIRMALPPGLADPIEQRIHAPDREQFAQAMPGAESAALERAPAQAAALAYLLAVGGRAALAEIAHAIPGSRESPPAGIRPSSGFTSSIREIPRRSPATSRPSPIITRRAAGARASRPVSRIGRTPS